MHTFDWCMQPKITSDILLLMHQADRYIFEPEDDA